MKNIVLKQVEECDATQLCALFYNTVHKINAKDYTPSQLDAWAPEDIDISTYIKKIMSKYAIVAKDAENILGYGNIDKNGFLDHLYVAENSQREGVGTLICDELENYAKKCGNETVTVEASITAKDFFGKRGYVVIKEQFVERKGVKLKNYVMTKNIML